MASEPDNLSARALRTVFNSFAQHFARLIVAFLATPRIILALGAERYGAWLVLQQYVSYLGLLDFQSMGTLKYKLSLEHHDQDIEKKRRLVGAALRVWLLVLPLLLPAALVLVLVAPTLIRVEAASIADLRIAFVLAALAIVFGRLLSLPANVLRGENQDFRATGPSIIAIFLGGLLSVAAVQLGLGLSGLSLAGILGIIFLSTIEYRAMKRFCPWFGISKPSTQEVKAFLTLSGAVFANSLSLLLLLSTDLILTAYLLSPSAAALLGATGAALRLGVEPFQQLLAGGNAGLMGLCGKGEWKRVATLRYEQRLLGIAILSVMGSAVLIFNGSFITLWIGSTYFGGVTLTLTLVVLTLLTVLLRCDAVILLSLGRMKTSSALALGAVAISVLFASIGAHFWGISGLVSGLCIGRLSMYIVQSIWLQKFFSMQESQVSLSLFRPTIVGGILVLLSSLIAQLVSPSGWMQLILWSTAISTGLVFIMFFVGFGSAERNLFIARIKRVTPSSKKAQSASRAE